MEETFNELASDLATGDVDIMILLRAPTVQASKRGRCRRARP